jgi:hypothetical protein
MRVHFWHKMKLYMHDRLVFMTLRLEKETNQFSAMHMCKDMYGPQYACMPIMSIQTQTHASERRFTYQP